MSVLDVNDEATGCTQVLLGTPSVENLGRLATVVWTHVEQHGGVRALDIKVALLRLAVEVGLDEEVSRQAINQAVPGPSNFDVDGNVSAAELVGEDEYASASAIVLRLGSLALSTAPGLPGWTVHETLGLVFGNTVRTRGMGAKLVTGIAANFGGELPMYTQLLTDARIEALNRLAAEARHRGANGVVGLAFNTSSVFETAIEVVAYGTAVRASRPQ